MGAGPIRIAILANGRQARAEATLTARSYERFGRTASRAGKVIAGAFAVASVARAGVAIERTGATYVNALNKIQALTGSTNAQMDRAAQKIEAQSRAYAKMGQTAGDAAGGIVELTKSGLSLKDSLAAVHATMVLAKAGELDVADASTLVANTINTFSLKASAASRIANGLANAANISSADVSDLAESFKYASPLAAKAGLSLDQVNAVLAELSNSGIKASQAGTSLRGILLGLQAPSTAGGIWLQDMGVKVYGANGKMRDFTDVIADLRKGIGKLSEQDANFALKSIFGRNSITAASVLIKGGKKELDQYTKGVQRAGAAQKLANAASKGLDGTLKSLKASVVSTTQALYRQYSPAVNAKLKIFSRYLSENQDEMIATATASVQKLEPALDSLGALAKSTGIALKDSAEPLAKVVVPAIVVAAKSAKIAVDAFNGLPQPIKTVAVQAGLAALVLPRLTAAVTSVTGSIALNMARMQQWRAEMTYTATRTQQTSAIMQRLGTAARTAAGIGGMLALAQASTQTNKALKGVELAAGGAALGFSLGGPIGALIGGAGGGLLGIVSAVKDVNKQWTESKPVARDYAASLNQITGAATRQTRALVLQALQQDDVINSANALGISTRDLISATLGAPNAVNRVTNAWKHHGTVLDGLANQKVSDWITQQGFNLSQEQQKIRENTDALKKHQGAAKTLNETLSKVGNTRANFSPFAQTMLQGLSKARRQAAFGTSDINKIIAQTTGKARANLSPLERQLASDLSATRGTASRGGIGIGNALKQGVISGFAGTGSELSEQASEAVHQAIASARAAGKIHSPSQEMRDKVGKPLAQGLVLGFVRGVTKGESEVKSALGRLMGVIESRLDGKKQAGRRKALLSSLSDERKKLIANGKAQDANNKKLDNAISKYKALTQRANQFAASIKSGFQSYGSVVGLGTTGGGTTVTSDALIAQLTARAQVASQFASVINKLRGKLNKTSLKQLLDQAASGDLEGALATAQAISSGGRGAIVQINALTAQISKVGGKLGNQMRSDFYGAGLKAADGLVEGLKKRQAQLDKVAQRLAEQLVSKVKKALGIHSPSRVFADIGAQTAKGLQVGINSQHTYVQRSASGMAASLRKGFGTPALDAYLKSSSVAAAPTATISITVNAGVGANGTLIGKEIVSYIDTYFDNGGRTKTKWGNR